jgi:hypothetical protein
MVYEKEGSFLVSGKKKRILVHGSRQMPGI